MIFVGLIILHIAPEITKTEPSIRIRVVITLPKTEYKIAEGLDTTGGTFVCTYSDGTTKTMELSNEYVYGFVDAYLSGVGEYDITVKYSEMGNIAETTYKITITR